ncbi:MULTISPECIES: 2Fe-2S iron-sulfur cluster-binding protein [Streptomyces]|uniref:2Fe-2S iron-sulfur cluster-binding protein n=1 Tax=Streptomyces TaxID=1883 RepID=UPI00187E88B2|nr:2Fe-2S iron-sulfur cluster-binding protein [Streptomyces justiciae]MBE8476466.1 2Fe-2S iron-sulfur cluster binding domain-containing protein [Streptomyces justiciae]
MTIVVHGRDQTRREVDVNTRDSLMLQLRPLKVGVIGVCGGNAVCGTCHVTVRPDQWDLLEPIDEYEEEMLETLPDRQPNSRLACQIVYTPALDGLELTVATRI